MKETNMPKKPKEKKEKEPKKPERKLLDTLEFKEIPGKVFTITSGKNEIGWEGFFVSVSGVEGEKYFSSEELARKNIDLCVFQAMLGCLDVPDEPPAYTQGMRAEIERTRLIEQKEMGKTPDEKKNDC